MAFTKVADAAILAADKIREDAARTFDQIRSRGELNADAIAALLARSYLTFKQAMDKLAQTTGQDSSATSTTSPAPPSTGPPRPSATATLRTG